jgi:hypothetical protein
MDVRDQIVFLDYLIGDYQPAIANDANVAQASLTDLTYRMFIGDVVFRVDGCSFDAQWGWIPVLDFAIQLYDSTRALGTCEEARLSFTENAEYVGFRRTSDHVAVSASYCSGSAEVPVDELEVAARKFLTRILADLSARWPSIKSNPIFLSINQMISSQDPRLIEQVLTEAFMGRERPQRG